MYDNRVHGVAWWAQQETRHLEKGKPWMDLSLCWPLVRWPVTMREPTTSREVPATSSSTAYTIAFHGTWGGDNMFLTVLQGNSKATKGSSPNIEANNWRL